MRLSRLVNEILLTVDNESARRWSASDAASQANIQIENLVRKMVELDRDYFNVEHVITMGNARQVHSNEFRYTIPPWCMMVVEVREQADVGEVRGQLIPRSDKYGRRRGWLFTAQNELALIGFSSALDLEIVCAKLPARMTLGTLPTQAGVAANQMRLDDDGSANALIYPHETLQDGYAGALFEITGVDTFGPSRFPTGQYKRCTSSIHSDDTGGVRYTVLTFNSDWAVAPVAGDTYEMHAQIADQHLRLVVLLATRALLSQERNLDGVRAFRDEIREQWASFINHIEKRDTQEPQRVKESLSPMRDSFSERFAVDLFGN